MKLEEHKPGVLCRRQPVPREGISGEGPEAVQDLQK